eukprot:2870466-Prymnesium_polylepis.1
MSVRAPAQSSIGTEKGNPDIAATMSAVYPLRVCKLMFAPRLSSKCSTSSRSRSSAATGAAISPLLAAISRGI